MSEDGLKKIISHAKEYGFVFPSSEIYDGLSAAYDYGQLGSELKNNIKQYWWTAMVRMNENIVGIDAAIFMHPTTWKASGHVDAFNDPLIDNKDSKKRYRADVLIEEHIAKIEAKINKDVTKAAKRFGDDFDEAQFRSTNPQVLRRQGDIDGINAKFKAAMDAEDLGAVKTLIEDLGITCPVSGSKNWTDVRQFNLMFKTHAGPVTETAAEVYLRPETAQGMFINFANVLNTSRKRPPFGIAQIGKSFRNEITPGNFVFRTREFEQMEMEFFVPPAESQEWYEYWCQTRMDWYLDLGMDPAKIKLRAHDDDELSHYSSGTSDVEYLFPWGWDELEGIANRGDFDLTQHATHSGEKLDFFDQANNERYVPHVIEPAAGATRTAMAFLMDAYDEEVVNDDTRAVLRLDHRLAPYKIAVLPLSKKDTLTPTAMEVFDSLKRRWMVDYDETQSIGKRYARQDEVGTPYCVTVDFDTLDDRAVTVRERDTREQDRVSLDQLEGYLAERLS